MKFIKNPLEEAGIDFTPQGCALFAMASNSPFVTIGLQNEVKGSQDCALIVGVDREAMKKRPICHYVEGVYCGVADATIENFRDQEAMIECAEKTGVHTDFYIIFQAMKDNDIRSTKMKVQYSFEGEEISRDFTLYLFFGKVLSARTMGGIQNNLLDPEYRGETIEIRS